MKINVSPSIFLIFLICSGIAHQLMYILLPVYATYILQTNNFELPVDRIVRAFLSLIIGIIFFLVIHSVFYEFRPYQLKGAFRYFGYFSFMLSLSLTKKETLYMFLTYASWFIVFLTPLGIYQVLTIERAELIFGQGNHLAYVVVVCFFFVFTFYFGRWKAFLLVTLFANILLSKSSGGLLVTLLFLLFKLNRQALSVIIGGSFVLGVAIVVGTPIFDRFVEQIQFLMLIDYEILLDKAIKLKFGSMGSGIWRLTYWLAIAIYFFQSPWYQIIFGLGIDSMTVGNFAIPFMNIDPHNDFLKILVEFGFFGLILLTIFLIRVIKMAGKSTLFLIVSFPMFFGNVLVDFPFMLLLFVVIQYSHKSVISSE